VERISASWLFDAQPPPPAEDGENTRTRVAARVLFYVIPFLIVDGPMRLYTHYTVAYVYSV
jgi:hypothetical protein